MTDKLTLCKMLFSGGRSCHFVFVVVTLGILVCLPQTVLRCCLRAAGEVGRCTSVAAINETVCKTRLVSVFFVYATGCRIVMFTSLFTGTVTLVKTIF